MGELNNRFDCAIVGGGLSGLCLAIQLSGKGISVVVFEKNSYPFHKVCGEYISMESWGFLESLGLPLHDMHLPVISKLGISSESGYLLNHDLKMGGFGISRYTLEKHLFAIAVQKGVTVLEQCRVSSVAEERKGDFLIQTSKGDYHAAVVCGSYGKYTPKFVQLDEGTGAHSGNYIGVKYHIRADISPDRIELHNFRQGYCGISRVEEDRCCLCYLTTARNLQENGKDIKAMEEHVLYRNPWLKRYFTRSEFLFSQPLVISNIHFSKMQTSAQGIFLLGDAAGSITPLCGNGMSMGMRASQLLATELLHFFQKKQTREEAAMHYEKAWTKAFGNRIMAGHYLQRLFGKPVTTDIALKVLGKLPTVMSRLVALTHGDPF
nr:NAD(P)/FAD-dependent oxidoreductase [uncultured Dyadobacter sp.]